MADTNVLSEILGEYLDGTGVSQFWAAVIANFVQKESGKGLSTEDFTSALLEKLNGIADGAQVNVLESVKVNNATVEIQDKAVNILVPTGALAQLDKVGEDQLTEALANLINGKANKATTLAGYGITDAYTKEEVDSKVASVYKVKGTTTFENLPTEGMEEGDTYNVTDAFTAGTSFVEAEQGKEYPAGTNVVYTENGWDALAGVYDFSNFAMKSEIPTPLTSEELARILVIPPATEG